MRLDHLLSRERTSRSCITVDLSSMEHAEQRKDSGGDAPGGDTRGTLVPSHPEHDG